MAFESPAPLSQVNPQIIPLPIAGGCHFGRYNKISNEQTWNMIVSDGALVDYAGYQNVFDEPLVSSSVGRGIYSSSNGNRMIVVIGSAVYSIILNTVTSILESTFVGELQTSEGDVFIAENNNNEIAITDEKFMYVYNYKKQPAGPLWQSEHTDVAPPYNGLPPHINRFYVPFVSPGYITFQNGRLIVADIVSQFYDLSGINDALDWDVKNTKNLAYQGSIGIKPDKVQAVVAFPGAGNNLAIFGHTVMELWQDVGNAIFPYQRSTTYNVDYGCLNASSIAALDSYIVWLSSNEQGGVTIMRVNGAAAREESISTDGIDYKLSNITDPTNCTGFLFRQDGHLIYQFTFPTDNISYIYDFDTKLFSNVSDENQNYHIARNVVFFNNNYYFVSLNDGNVYNFGTQFSNLQYSETNIQQMPRIRILPPIRLPSQRMFITKSIGFTVENGQYNDTMSECIDFRVSRDGGETFSSAIRNYMNPTGKRKSRMIFQRLGQANDLTAQIQFIGFGRFIAFDGVAEVYT